MTVGDFDSVATRHRDPKVAVRFRGSLRFFTPASASVSSPCRANRHHCWSALSQHVGRGIGGRGIQSGELDLRVGDPMPAPRHGMRLGLRTGELQLGCATAAVRKPGRTATVPVGSVAAVRAPVPAKDLGSPLGRPPRCCSWAAPQLRSEGGVPQSRRRASLPLRPRLLLGCPAYGTSARFSRLLSRAHPGQ